LPGGVVTTADQLVLFFLNAAQPGLSEEQAGAIQQVWQVSAAASTTTAVTPAVAAA